MKLSFEYGFSLLLIFFCKFEKMFHEICCVDVIDDYSDFLLR